MSTTPPIGSMYLYDDITPPLVDNSYRLDIVTEVTYDGQTAPLSSNSGYFDIEGPRFSLPVTDVAGVFPPRNGHGGFAENMPQIVISRRTLPWERRLTSNPSLIGTPLRDGLSLQPNPFPVIPGEPAEFGPAPWMALLLFQEGEYTLHQNVPLNSVVPADVYARLEVADGITCDAIEVEGNLLQSVLPSLDELTLLAHVRQVNVDDRELSAAGGTGFYAVVMSNRLPAPGAKFRACLVSLEERTDLVTADPPPVASPLFGVVLRERFGQDLLDAEAQGPAVPLAPPQAPDTFFHSSQQTLINTKDESLVLKTVSDRNVLSATAVLAQAPFQFFILTEKVVLLHSWVFECTGVGTFRDYVQRINVSMMGTVEEPGHPPVTDTGHVQVQVANRAGVQENTWYRGPFVPMPLTRDPLTYHSADQCRRVTPETGAEDISYAAAFEAGRMMAAADPRLAQELTRWRRESFRQSVRTDSLSAISNAIPLAQALEIHKPVASVVAISAAQRMITGVDQVGDKYGLGKIASAPGLLPAELQSAWGLADATTATALLGGNPGSTGAVVETQAQTLRPATTLAQVAVDTASLNYLQNARDSILASVQTKLER